MPTRFRKSFSGKGFRVNVGKHGVSSISFGVPGARITTGKKGTHLTAGLPGTGLSYTQRAGSNGTRNLLAVSHSLQDSDYIMDDNSGTSTTARDAFVSAQNIKIAGFVVAGGSAFLLVIFLIAQSGSVLLIASVIGVIAGLGIALISRRSQETLAQKIVEEDAINQQIIAENQRIRQEIEEEKRRRSEFIQSLERMDIDKMARICGDYFVSLGLDLESVEVIDNDAAVVTVCDSDEKLIVLVVHSFKPVGVSYVRRAQELAMREMTRGGVLVTNATYTTPAIKEAVEKKVSLMDIERIINFAIQR